MMTKAYAYLKGAQAVAKSNDRLADTIACSNRRLGEKLESISQAEIKSKDRVDITLEEYERMKSEIKRLTYENEGMREILGKIEAPLDKKIIPDSIRTWYCEDIMNCRNIFHVEFAIDEWDMR
jgi:hypothetical protein